MQNLFVIRIEMVFELFSWNEIIGAGTITDLMGLPGNVEIIM